MMNLLRCLLIIFYIFNEISMLQLQQPSRVPCPPVKIKNGRTKYRQRGRFVRFTCNVGFMLAGERFSTCQRGKWDGEPPKCVKATCQQEKTPSNGLIYRSHGGGVLNFYCKPNYQLRGPSITYCDGHQWNNALPTCLKTNTTPSLHCDFETDDLCGWNHDLNHDFNWQRYNLNTPSGSIGTGPSYDHTKGDGQKGYYMYIESSSRNENDTARLISPIYDPTTTQTCFEFFYHMFGATIGSLRVYLKLASQNWTLNRQNAIFVKDGNQGNHWYRAFLDFGIIKEDYQIVIEGVRGSGYVSDIAIDDVTIVENCTYIEPTTTIEPDEETEMIYTIETCENRCHNTTNLITIDSYIMTCDCDDSCFDRNRCCPDYIDVCVLGTSTPGDVIDETSTTEITETSETIRNDIYVSESLRFTMTILPTTTKTPIKTTKKWRLPTTTAPRLPTTTKIPIKTTKKWRPPTTTTPRLPTTTKTTKQWRPPTTTPSTVKKTTTPTKTTTLKPIKTTTMIINRGVVFVTPDIDNDLNNDIVDILPNHDTNKELENLSPINDNDNDIIPSIVPTTQHEKLLDNRVIEKMIITHHNLSDKDGDNTTINYSKTIFFACGIIFGILFGLVIVIFTIKHYHLFYCNKLFLRHNGSRRRYRDACTDGASDVLFLTSEDQLDLRLPNNYDTL